MLIKQGQNSSMSGKKQHCKVFRRFLSGISRPTALQRYCIFNNMKGIREFLSARGALIKTVGLLYTFTDDPKNRS